MIFLHDFQDVVQMLLPPWFSGVIVFSIDLHEVAICQYGFGGVPSHEGTQNHPVVMDDHDLLMKQPWWLGDPPRCKNPTNRIYIYILCIYIYMWILCGFYMDYILYSHSILMIILKPKINPNIIPLLYRYINTIIYSYQIGYNYNIHYTIVSKHSYRVL